MHKRVSSLLLLALLLTMPTALPQTLVPPAPMRVPARIPPPDPALRAAFDATTRSDLNEIALAGFRGQPLAGWLEYATLRRQMDALPLERGTRFLADHAGEPVASSFREEWLVALARRNAWSAFLAAWDPTISSPMLRCLRLQALMQLDQIDPAWTREAQTLWRQASKPLPSACDAPMALLAARGELADSLRWERFDAALQNGQTALLRAIASGMSPSAAALAQRYADYLDAPDTHVEDWPATARSRQVASIALQRLARTRPEQAETLLPEVARALALDDAGQGQVRHAIALWSAASYAPEAARRLAAVPASAYDPPLHEWRVREALARADWNTALAAIAAMPEAQRRDSRWQYIAARLHELTGQQAAARGLYAQAAQKSDFYGFLAADRLGLPYTLCPLLPQASPSDWQQIANDAGLIRAIQLFLLDRRTWALREWNALLPRLSSSQRRLAVQLAQDNGWFDRGVFGLAGPGDTRAPDDQRLYTLRFPLAWSDLIHRQAQASGLDPAWISAEIRAESVFDPHAVSSANARGLMQLLPEVGATLAQQLNLPWNGATTLDDPALNITLGSAYLRQLLDRHDGLPYLAIAAYNAGPSAVARWRSQRPALPADLWIETIPYRETRDYVARVLAFSVLYDWRLRGDALPLSDRLLGKTDSPRKRFFCPSSEPVRTPSP